MDFRQLDYFVTAAERQSLSAAAELLYTSQPHVSSVIRSLEQELGTKLFDRTHYGVRLTEQGRRVYDYAVRALTEQRLMADAAAQRAKESLSIITTPSSNMAALFTDYYQIHDCGNCHYRYYEGGVETVLSRVSSGEAELGFVFIAERQQPALRRLLEQHRLRFDSLLNTDLVLYVGENSPLHGRQSVSLDELRGLRFVQNEDDFFSISDLLSVSHPSASVMPICVVRTNSDYTMMQLLKTTDLCNLSSYWLKDRYTRLGVQRLTLEGFGDGIRFGCITAQGRPLSHTAEHFLTHVRLAIAGEQNTSKEI
ncbi:MAG: LysR family transcriptional regulator [Oscillospiraceae bacterium]|nr:LysR family transcriptional regulator [Oscillospiraceae bacterium]